MLVVGCSINELPEEAPATLIQNRPAVNSWPKNNHCVEAARPARCQKCSAPSRTESGGIRLQGHGERQRGPLGPPSPDAKASSVVATVRRYRCTACGGTQDVSPPGLARRYRYSLPAIASALFLWAFERVPANQVRDEISPHRFVGLNRTQRWRSLLRWTRAAPALFGADSITASTLRDQALRIARWIRATRPPGGSERERIFFAAQVF